MRSKRSKGGNSGKSEGVDRISNLEDSLLCHILSFLLTKEAVAASVLSRRWKLLWTKVPVIDLDGELYYAGRHFEKKLQYQNFVHNVLLLNKETFLRFCRLTLPHDVEVLHCNAWIEAIAVRNVKEMHLKGVNIELPGCVFNCEKLEVLTLGRGIEFPCPSSDEEEAEFSVHLPNLRVLNIVNIIGLYSGSSLKLLTSSCPVLGELVIDSCKLIEFAREVYVCSSSLKKLQITYTQGTGGELVIIDTPSLEYVTLANQKLSRYDVSNLSSLKEADIDYPRCWYHEPNSTYRTNILKLVNSVASSNTLRLRRSMVQGIQDCILDRLPIFNNLKCLELEIYENRWWTVASILKRTPHLVSLSIGCASIDFDTNDDRSDVTHVPRCLSHSIKKIQVQNFNDFEDSMNMVIYLLMSARVLNKMKICCFDMLSPVEEMKILKKLLSFTRGSTTCRVEISSSSS